MRPGRAVGLLLLQEMLEEAREWGRLQVIKFGVPLMTRAVKTVVATVGKLSTAADAAPSQPEPGCSSCPHLHSCLLCLPSPALRHTLSNTAKYYIFTVLLSIMAIYL